MSGNYLDVFILFIFGLGSGIFVGTAAGTAATLLIPCMTILIGYATHQAIGTSLAVDFVIGGIAGLIFLKNKKVDVKPAFLLIVFGVLGTIFGSRLTSSTPEIGLNVVLGGFLLFVGINFVRNGVQKNVEYLHSKVSFSYFKQHKTFSFIVLGLVVGVISGLIGIGGSRTLAIILIFIMGYHLHTAIGTSLVMMFFIAGTGAVSHAFRGEIVLGAVMVAGLGAALGAMLGSSFANKIPEDKLARFVGAIISVLGFFLIIKIFI